MIRLTLFRVLEMQETDTLARFSILISALLGLILLNCSELSEYDNQRIREALGDSLTQSSTTLGLDMDVIENGSLRMNLQSTRAHTLKIEGTNTTLLSGPVRIKIFEADTLDAMVFSDSATYIPSVNIVELFGSVIVETSTGKWLSSDHLKWVRRTDEVSTPGPVIIVTETDSINAIGFTGNTDLTSYILNQVTGETVIN